MFENQKKGENMEINFFYINLHPRDRIDIEFTACKCGLMPKEALISFTVFNAYRWFAGPVQTAKFTG